MALRMVTVAVAAALAAASAAAFAQEYPARTVEVISPYQTGGTTDILGRPFIEEMARHFGKPFILVARPGANGAIGVAATARAQPDGHTLTFTTAVSLVVNPLVQKEPGYTLDSFDHICQTFSNEMVLVVRPDSPFKTVEDIINAGRANPGKLNYANVGHGSIPHLAVVELSNVAKVEFNAIPFKGGGEVVQQVMGGHVDFASATLTSVAHTQARIVGLFGKQRNPGIPNVPTFRELGYDVAPESLGGVSAPKGLPAPVRQRLEEACKIAAHSDTYVKAARAVYQPTNYYAGGADYTEALHKDVVVKRKLLEQVGMLKK
jgi:tripartite-type tricarboxylate transporter receptor subunit TctC